MRKLLLICVVALAAVSVSAASAAPEKSGPQVIRSGKCSGPANWKLKLKNDDGRLEIEFEVDQNIAGRHWNVALKRNGRVVFRGVRITRAPSGSFTVEKRPAGLGGKVVATGRSGAQVCRGVASL